MQVLVIVSMKKKNCLSVSVETALGSYKGLEMHGRAKGAI